MPPPPPPATAAAAAVARYDLSTPPHSSSKTKNYMYNYPDGGAAPYVAAVPDAPRTPSAAFDFADYVNITPSPARPMVGLPGFGVGAGNDTRRHLTYDQ